jgi:hypothetical protein
VTVVVSRYPLPIRVPVVILVCPDGWTRNALITTNDVLGELPTRRERVFTNPSLNLVAGDELESTYRMQPHDRAEGQAPCH